MVAAAGMLAVAPRGAEAQQTLTRNALTAADNTLGNLSGWSTSGSASGVTPTSITASDTLSFTNWWTPGKLSSARLWFDAADKGTVTLASGVVSDWNNKVVASADNGNASKLTQGNSAFRPAYVTSGTSTLNGLPALNFDGSNDSLRTNGSFSTNGWSQMTILAVDQGFNTGKGVSSRYNLGYAQSVIDGGYDGSMLNVNDSGSVGLGGRPTGGGTFYLSAAGPVSLAAPALTAASWLGTSTNNMISYANGVAGTPTNPAGGNGGTTMIQDNAFWLDVAQYNGTAYKQNTGEILVTNSSDTTQRQLAEGYMAWKWGTQSLLPSNHPYKNAPPVSAAETYYTGGNQSAAGLNFSGSSSATTLLGGTSGGAAADTMTIGSGGITVAAATGATTLGAASGATVSLVVGADQTWTNNSSSLLRAHNGISRAAGDVTNRVLTIAGSGSTQLDGAITNGGAAGTLGLVKQGAGLLLLGGANTFTGSTTITGGTLALGAAATLASAAISVGSGAVLDLSALAFTLGGGQSIGGKGSILGNLVFGAGSKFAFTPSEPLQLTLSSGSASFASTFGIADVLGLDSTTPVGTYTLLAGTVNFANVINVGEANAVSIGDDKSAYLQQGSLQLVVVSVPEPGAATLAGLGAGIAAWTLRRRRRASR